jgi:hypothetical protein
VLLVDTNGKDAFASWFMGLMGGPAAAERYRSVSTLEAIFGNGSQVKQTYKDTPQSFKNEVGITATLLSVAPGPAAAFLSRLLGLAQTEGGSAPIPAKVYRSGGKNPANLTPRPQDKGMLSTRDSLSNPWPKPSGQQPPLPPDKPIQVIDTSKLPPGTVVPDGAPSGPMPDGHVSIGPNVPAGTVKDAIVQTIPPPDKPD